MKPESRSQDFGCGSVACRELEGQGRAVRDANSIGGESLKAARD